ncbi:Methionine biosynthesis protein MetW [Methanocella conradii HZ254]|uniref:Methionine biosynthesis protein MetW n=1 Tax=Methanocella conradii (strain DSM 24694 / JCM 17849 / CGMCC 1.5162 / HZ254) TaxID=1041930 RepID=H8I6Q7_METCZ|nr:methionine biosynthesis protein MetW [Methanocella conradii]AFC99377.1 Methionine biosynthesis protein MetW [Methanocella conradii HZ254]
MGNNLETEEINVEEIMKKIKENVYKKMALAQNTLEPRGAACIDSVPENADLAYIRNNWYIHNNDYKISSHRKFVGPVLIKGRELVLGEIKRYMDPIISRQNDFNSHVANAIVDLNKERINLARQTMDNIAVIIDSRTDEIKNEIKSQIKADIQAINEQTLASIKALNEQTTANISAANEKMMTSIEALKFETESLIEDRIGKLKVEVSNDANIKVKEVLSDINKDIENKAWLAGLLERRINDRLEVSSTAGKGESIKDINYFVFEERFRGSSNDIKQKQAIFLPYYKGCKNVLDIGCGRGEFLEMMRENGIVARGIDIDDDMIDYCQSKGLDVEKIDAIAYLERIEDKSLDGIFIDQVIEHLEPEYLIRMLKLCFDKLKFGYYLCAETVNPLSLTSFANFYIDMTHKRPVHPETLRFLFSMAGFRELEVKFTAPVEDRFRLKKIDIGSGLNENEQKAFTIYNQNIDRLNDMLFGYQDYSVIGKK